jgi:hypothetical protein
LKTRIALLLLHFFVICMPRLEAQSVIDSFALYGQKYLLRSTLVQIEATQAIDDMYNFKFDKAANQFNWFAEKYPKHPFPFFLLALNECWKMMPNPEKTQYDSLCFVYLDQSIALAQQLYEQDKQNIEASFFLAASYAFKSRIHADRKHWTRAINMARKALGYLRQIDSGEEMHPEWLMGEGLYNYYAKWIRENYPLLRPVMLMFRKGNQELGLQQLQKASQDAFYTRIEALQFLMMIYLTEEEKPDKALPIAQYLHEHYPDNSYFERYYLTVLYNQNFWEKAEAIAIDIERKIDAGMAGYEAIAGRYACYYLGNLAMYRYGDVPRAQGYYERAVGFAESIQAYDSRYYQNSLLALGNIEDNKKNYKQAKIYYDRVKKHAKRKSTNYKKAKEKNKYYQKNNIITDK